MTDLKSRADELIDRTHLDTSAASWDRMNSEDYTEATRPSRAALTRFVHALCECAELLDDLLDEQNGPPLLHREPQWKRVHGRAIAALAALEKGEKV